MIYLLPISFLIVFFILSIVTIIKDEPKFKFKPRQKVETLDGEAVVIYAFESTIRKHSKNSYMEYLVEFKDGQRKYFTERELTLKREENGGN